jgi:AmmeMemoRadiSam system protein A
MADLDIREGERAVAYARSVIEQYLTNGSTPDPDGTVDRDGSALVTEGGAFVTLETDGNLRGCIGRPYPRQPVIEAVRESAIGAATNDPRFRPVDRDELADIAVEVSVLGPPAELSASMGADSVPIDVGRDGLIVRDGARSGLLLPQVPVEHDWDVETFLAQTCRKAGLSKHCWRDGDVTVERFTADVFRETTPGGPVEPVPVSESAMG